MPSTWVAEAKAIKNVHDRAVRRKARDEAKRSKFPKPGRNPSIGNIRDNFSGNKAIQLFSPLQERKDQIDDEFFEVVTEVNVESFNNPASQANISFQKSIEIPKLC